MYVGDSERESELRATARAWLAAHPAPATSPRLPLDERLALASRWQQLLHDHGWAGLAWPTEFGGRGGTPIEAAIFQQEETQVLDWRLLKRPLNVALNIAAPTLMAFGTPEHRGTHLPAILRGEQYWCQLFSEPSAGSDLSSLRTMATRDGSRFVVNGQKVWTSYAHYAHYGLLLARTDPDAPKHRGLSYFVIDMRTAGISIRPLRQMSGASEFNEVFFDDVVIADSCLLGGENDGWTVAHATLANERQYLGAMAFTERKFPMLFEAARRAAFSDEAVARQRLAACYTREQVLRYLGFRVQTAISNGDPIGPTGSVLKLAQAQHVTICANDLLSFAAGAGLAVTGEDWDLLEIRDEFLVSPGMRIGGGTDNIQKQTIAERILGLPRERDDERSRPWRSVEPQQ
ncbi:MAG: acyl-CoA dehydrogenase family protein [Acidimicrobiales bacterium]